MDETYVSVCKSLASILKGSIVVNELSPRKGNAGSYVLIGLSEDAGNYVVVRSTVEKKTWKLTDCNELYAIRKRSIKKADVGSKPPHYIQKNGYGSSATISIANFLELVNEKFADTFTEDLYAALEMQREESSYAKSLLYQRRRQIEAYTEYEKPITVTDVEELRSIGRKSVHAFSSTDIQKSQKWAHKFYQEIGVKSPFFRAWFGDWRAHDTGTVKVVNIESKEGKNPRGTFKNRDTGWNIVSSSVGYDETISHSGKNKYSIAAMQSIDFIIENAVLLDTEVSEYGRGKKSVYTAFMHKFYAPAFIDGKLYIAKMAVDESYSPGQEDTHKKFYHVRTIEIEAASSVGIGFTNHTPIMENAASEISISDLFSLVKEYDGEFHPKAVDPVLLNEDGTPKVFYHGTSEDFTSFSSDEIAAREGFFFMENREDAAAYGDTVIPVYLASENLADYDNQPYEFYRLKDKSAQVDYLKERGYDGWYADMDSDGWGEVSVFYPSQIKSATDNIGTFDRGSADIRYQRRRQIEAYTEYEKPITVTDVEELRSIGRKSVHAFSSTDIQKSQKWAYKFYQELGTKSPFFRTWFGDWRAHDTGTVKVVSDLGVRQSPSVNNKDTGWNIILSRALYKETTHKQSKSFVQGAKYLPYAEDILKNAILLDTTVSETKPNRSDLSAFFHSLYAYSEALGEPVLLKMQIEELIQEKGGEAIRRTYTLQSIKAVPLPSVQLSGLNQGSETASTISISDLFSLVKQYDGEFHPKSVDPVLLNEDGAPKVFYHGTMEDFTSFSPDEIGAMEGYFFFAENREDAAAYGDTVIPVYLSSENLADYDNQPYEFYRLKDKSAQVDYLKERGYDGWYADMDSDGGGEVSVFYPSQIKSATDNIGTFDRGSADIRYQRRRQTVAEKTEAFREIQKAHEALQSGTELLKELLQYQKESGKGQRYTQDSLLTIAGILKKDFHLDLNKLEIVPVLNRVYEQITQEADLTYEQLDAFLTEAARDIGVQKEKKPKRTEYAARALGEIRKSKVVFNEAQREEAAALFGSYEAYRKSLFGSVTLANEGISLDSIWQEWAQLYPEVFDRDIGANDQPAALSDAIEVLKNAYEYGAEMDDTEFINRLSRAIYDGYWRASTLKEVNGKYRKDIYRLRSLHMQMMDSLKKADQQRGQDMEKLYRRMIRDIRRERNARLEAYREKVQKSRGKETERRLKIVEKNRVQKIYNNLSGMLQHPTQKKHVPQKLVYAVADVLDAINMDTVGADARAAAYDERIAKEGDVYKASALMATQARIRAQGERMRSALLEVHSVYEQMKNDKAFAEFAAGYDKDVSDMLVGAMQVIPAKSIREMTCYELRQVGNALSAVQKTIQRSLGGEEYRENKTAYAQADRMIAETRSIGKAKGGRISRAVNGAVNAMARPETMFERLGNFTKGSAWMEQYEKLNQGQLKQTQIQMEAGQLFAELIGREQELRTLSDIRKTVDIGLKDENGSAVKITRGMMLSIYMHLQNKDNARHMLVGGLRLPELVKYYKQSGKDAYDIGSVRIPGVSAELVRLERALTNKQEQFEQATDARMLQELQGEIAGLKQEIRPLEGQWKAARTAYLANIEEQLTEYERAWIRAAQAFFDVFCKEKLTETTMELYGFKRPMVKNYFPIHTDSRFREATFEAVVRDKSLEHAGAMQERVHASNPIMLEDITAVIQSQIDFVSKYCGVLPALKAFGQVYSKTQQGYADSVQNAVSEVFGNDGVKYIDDLLSDLQGARQRDFGLFDRARGNLAYATLTLNPRVAMAQAASFPTAAAVLGWKAVNKALVKGGKGGHMISRADTELIAKYSPLLYYRMQGYSSVEMADIKNMQQLRGRVDSKLRFLTGWIQAVDGATVGRLWYAAEYYVQDHFGELAAGTDAYYQKVAEWFNKVVEQTQPNYTVMQRPDILRDPNALTRQLTMFMTQRLQNFNIVYESVARLNRYRADYKNGRNGVTEADVKEAWHGVARAVSSQLAAGVTIVAMKMLSDLLLLGLGSYKDEDDELTWESLGLGALDLFADTMFSNIVGGSELYGIIKARVGNSKWYGISLSGVGVFEDALEALLKLGKGDKIDTVNNFAMATCRLMGIPAGNAEKLLAGVGNLLGNIATFETPEKFQYDMTFADWAKAVLVAHDLSPVIKKNGQNANILYRAIMDGDQKKVDSVTDALKKEGETKKDIDALIKSGLGKNDERIIQAAQMRISGDSEGYAALAEEIAGDGFEKQLVIDAITSAQKSFLSKAEEAARAVADGKDKEYKEAVKVLTGKGYDKQFVRDYIGGLSPEEYTAEEQFDVASGVIQLYNAGDVYISLENGLYEQAQDIVDSIYNANLEKEVLRGKTEEKARTAARNSLRSALRTKYKQQYLNADEAERERIRNILTGLIVNGNLLFQWEDILKWEEDA